MSLIKNNEFDRGALRQLVFEAAKTSKEAFEDAESALRELVTDFTHNIFEKSQDLVCSALFHIAHIDGETNWRYVAEAIIYYYYEQFAEVEATGYLAKRVRQLHSSALQQAKFKKASRQAKLRRSARIAERRNKLSSW